MRKSIAAAVVAACAATSACGMAHGQDGGPTVSKSYSVGNFDQIEVGGPFNVEVRTGANPGVTARGPQHILEHLIVEVRGGKLVIRPEHQNGLFRSGWHFNGDVDVSVTVPMLRSAALGGSGDLKVNEVRGDSFEGSIGGSGGLEVGRVDVQSLKLAVSGSGGAKAAGRANTAAFDIAGSGDIDAKGVQSETADVSVAGSGSVAANATHTASVSIIGSGDVEVTGGAKCSVTKTGSGDATCS